MSDLAERYGTVRTGRRRWAIALLTVLVLVALAWLVWAAVFHSRPLVSSQLRGFSDPTEHFVDAQVTVVRRTADVEATCLLRAQSVDHAIVGELSFTVDSSEPATATLTRTIRTEREATSVSLVGCNAPPDQAKMR